MPTLGPLEPSYGRFHINTPLFPPAMAVTTSSVAGVIAGMNPLEWTAGAPYTVFLFQAVFIILLCNIVHYPIRPLQQPRVIAEVITGILLGPSVMGHIPGFTKTCFLTASMPGLTLFANIGIILFLFIIGMEVDVQFIKRNLRVSVTVGLINMAVPFALGCGIAKGLYEQYRHDDPSLKPISFTTFMVFIAVAMSITAFPVLVRILTELNLIVDRVGTIALAAGIINDLTGWILLALAVTLANSSKGINTLYILLLTLAWFLFLMYPVRLSMRFLLKKFTNDLVSGEPSQMSMMFILVCVFISAFYTNIIGVHPIFGAFMVGMIVPRDNGYVIKITEKLEDLVHIVFIPLYFALAGLSVNLGLLDRGIDWAYIVAIILLALFGKISSGFIAAKLNKMLWRESLAVGVLMSCKGIVEIVALSVGLNAGIISQRVYSMFVVMALVTTFLTTPLTLWVYPVWYREKVAKFRKGEINWDGTPVDNVEISDTDASSNKLLGGKDTSLGSYSIDELYKVRITKIVLLMKSIDTVSYLMSFIHNFALNANKKSENYSVDVKAVHLREFTSRTSHLLEASSQTADDQDFVRSTSANDNETSNSSSILSIMKIFAELLGINYSSRSLLSPSKNHLLTVNEQISEISDLLISSIKTSHLIQEAPDVRRGLFPEVIDNVDFTLFSKLFSHCKSHFGLLLIHDKKQKKLDSINEYDDNDLKYTSGGIEGTSLFNLTSVNLVLEHDDLISASDLLALHIVYKLAFNLSKINIYVKSKSAASSSTTPFEKQIKKLLSHNLNIKLTISHIKDTQNFADELLRLKSDITGETFIVANNTPRNNNDTRLFENGVAELVGLSVVEGFNVLVVKAASH